MLLRGVCRETAVSEQAGDMKAPPRNRSSPPVRRKQEPKQITNGADHREDAKYLPDIHRLLPQAADAEQGALCSFMIAPDAVGAICSEMGITPDHFYLPAHQEIFSCANYQ